MANTNFLVLDTTATNIEANTGGSVLFTEYRKKHIWYRLSKSNRHTWIIIVG